MPPLRDILDSAVVVALPLVTRFRGLELRETMLFEGPRGWTEFAPFVEYADAEASSWLRCAIDFGWEPPPKLLRNSIRVNATVPAVASARVPDVLARFPGVRTAKVKVAEPGQTLADDIARVRAVREQLGPVGRVRVDANGGWNVDEAERAVHALAEFDLEYAEQPCATIPELVELRGRIKHLGIPIAADESVRRADDPLAVARAGAADLLVIKAAPLGGIRSAMALIATAGLPVVVSSALESSVGLAAGLHLAAALPDFGYDSGLGTASLLAGDVTDDPLQVVDGCLPVRRGVPTPTLLRRHAASVERTDWWKDRLIRCFGSLPEPE